jgi:hypothetical protein
LIVLGFGHAEFHRAIIGELQRLPDDETVLRIDALAVQKDADGAIEVQHLSKPDPRRGGRCQLKLKLQDVIGHVGSSRIGDRGHEPAGPGGNPARAG